MYVFRADVTCYVIVSLIRTLVPQMRIPPIMPQGIHGLNSYGVGVAAFLLELSMAISYEEMSVWYGSYVVTYVLCGNDVASATR